MFRNKLILSFVLISSVSHAAIRPIPQNESIIPLLKGVTEVTSLDEISRLGLNSASTELELWSGHYWPNFQGGIAVRYRDPGFIKLIENKSQFKSFKELLDKTPLYTYSGNENMLSPAEKYDLLVGDSSMGLTQWSWKESEKMQGVSGSIPLWRGICDGWSAAAQMLPRPSKSVTLTNPSGLAITFYPEDIKALGSMIYANSLDKVIFLGKRCRSQLVGAFSGSCNGTNAGAFHKALVNRVGKMKKSFIADVSPSKEVWNYPVQSYNFTFYNVFTDEESKNFKDSMEPFIKKNRFSATNKRHEKTAYIVGVKAKVNYINMRPANILEKDSSFQDEILDKEYYYDLELDKNFNILGGEWFSSNGPDFMWLPDNSLKYLQSEVEEDKIPVTQTEISTAAKVASKNGQPLGVIVQKLFELSKEE